MTDSSLLAKEFIDMTKSNNDEEVIRVCDSIADLFLGDNDVAPFKTDIFVEQLLIALKSTKNCNTITSVIRAINEMSVDDEEGQELFCTPEVRDAIVACSRYANAAEIAGHVCL